ncbi:MAG TPA: cyanophycinase [Pirellulales bacterium]|nr:cyanophycinase [Pirellulales bacterium]
MISSRNVGYLAFVVIVCGSPCVAFGDESSTIGPKRGSLFIGGGGLREPLMLEFVELAGGPDAAIVVIPTATETGASLEEAKAFRLLHDAGAKNLTLLHTRDREVADSAEFVAPLETAQAVWIGGGRQWRLVDAYLGTRTVTELCKLLDRGGTIGGSSAGASIQASFLVRGDPRGNNILIARGYTRGFGFLRDSAIDQHLLTRKRQEDLVDVIGAHPKLLGVGIDEDTAVIVRGNRLEIRGTSQVAIYDSALAEKDPPYLLLSAGDVFDLETRKQRKSP